MYIYAPVRARTHTHAQLGIGSHQARLCASHMLLLLLEQYLPLSAWLRVLLVLAVELSPGLSLTPGLAHNLLPGPSEFPLA